MKLFGTDGIRGKYGDYPLDKSTIKKIGFAISHILNDGKIEKIFISHDGRESHGSILSNLIKGISSDHKYEIIYLDLLPTPAMSFILNNTSLDSIGIQITASHNPYTDNGIKIFNKLGFKINQFQENEIEKIVDSEDEIMKNNILDISHDNTYRGLYINFLSELVSTISKTSQKLNIAVDCANGATSKVISDINWPKNISFTIVNNSPNGQNINDKCGAVHPEYLSNLVYESNKKNKSDYIHFGICFDGDGDRAIIIDSMGNILDGDDLLYLFAYYLKPDVSEQVKVVGTVMTNYGIRNNLEKHGITFLETDVGDKNVLEAIMNNNAYIGAESSGHIIHTNIPGVPIGDGLITLIKFIHLLFKLNKNISDIYPASNKIPSKLININIDSTSQIDFKEKHLIIFTKVEKMLKNNGRILIRKSGTQPLIRVLIEHESEKILNEAELLIKSIK